MANIHENSLLSRDLGSSNSERGLVSPTPGQQIPIVILLSAWATVARAITPPKGLPVFIPPPGWLESAEIIGYIAQNFVKWYRRRSPFYEWLLPPQLDSIELVSEDSKAH